MAEDKWPQRKHLPHYHGIDRHNQGIIHFVTVCTKDRRSLLANSAVHQIILDAWGDADSFLVGRYVLMPDHVHLFCSPVRETSGYLESWVKYWKSLVTRRMPHIGKGNLWQRDFWDTQLRHSMNYSSQWDYVYQNPVRHGLVMKPEDWPYQGELNSLDWVN